MGACRKKPAQPASGTLSWMTPSETLLRLCLGGFGDMKWAWGGGWRLPAFLCQTTSSPGFCPISRAHFRDRKTLRKRVHHKGPPLNHVVDFFISCDGVARRFFWKDEEPFFEISSAQKLNYIMPGWISSVNMQIQELLYIVCMIGHSEIPPSVFCEAVYDFSMWHAVFVIIVLSL